MHNNQQRVQASVVDGWYYDSNMMLSVSPSASVMGAMADDRLTWRTCAVFSRLAWACTRRFKYVLASCQTLLVTLLSCRLISLLKQSLKPRLLIYFRSVVILNETSLTFSLLVQLQQYGSFAFFKSNRFSNQLASCVASLGLIFGT